MGVWRIWKIKSGVLIVGTMKPKKNLWKCITVKFVKENLWGENMGLTAEELNGIMLGLETIITQLSEIASNLVDLKEKLKGEFIDTEKP